VNSKQLGDTGVQVSELALGTWRYRGGVEPLRAGIELGATFIDTAESYGTEATVGEAVGGIRSRIFLASKVSPRHFREKDVIRAAEMSLRQLNTDYLDLYQLHWPNYTVPIAETMAAMERLVEMGKVRFIGVSNFTVAELDRAQRQLRSARIVSNQVKYSLIHRDPERKLLPYCAANGISLLAFSPLGSGPDALLRADAQGVLGRIGERAHKTPAQIGLNWCLSHPGVVAIFKADKLEHVRENCKASGWYLSSEDFEAVSKGVKAIQNRSGVEWFARRLARRVCQYMGRNLAHRPNWTLRQAREEMNSPREISRAPFAVWLHGGPKYVPLSADRRD
jgi:diketogulonate reductase-like aldo/keto reductase